MTSVTEKHASVDCRNNASSHTMAHAQPITGITLNMVILFRFFMYFPLQ